MEKYLNLLETIPLFHGIARDDIPVILKRLKATTSDFEKGEYIRSEGDAADFIGIVMEIGISISLSRPVTCSQKHLPAPELRNFR